MRFIHCQLLFAILSLITVCFGVPNKLRRYKICNGTQCKSIRSFNPPSFLEDVDSFLYSRWSKWTSCTQRCTTKRQRACKFPLICGNTVIQEEAFCYRRGSHCEYIFENNQRDYLAGVEDYSDYETQINSNEKSGRHLSHLNSLVDFEGFNEGINEIIPSPEQSNSRNRQSNNKRRSDRQRIQSRNRNATGYVTPLHSSNNLGLESEGPFPVQEDEGQITSSETCGVARITDRNRNGIAMRILGGQETKQGRWPWQVAVLNKMNEVFCGGTLIAPRWILTAAHCIRKRLQVTIGEHHLHRDEGTEKHYKIEAAFIHPDFDPETVDNDIALLLLPEPVPVEAGLACLPLQNQVSPPPGTLCTILGWGKERHTHVFGTHVLHEGKVPLVSNGECRYTYGYHEITNNMFCAGYRRGTVDSCAGDSGGPILCSVESRWTAFGVTSFGDGCGRKGKYGIYAKVSNYVGWINKVMKANDYLN